MENTTIINTIAKNAAFNRLFNRLTKLVGRAAEPWMLVDPAQVVIRRARLKEILGQLKDKQTSVRSFGVLHDAIGALETSIDDVVREVTALVEDAVEVVGTMPGFFALMTREEKLKAMKQVVSQPEFESRLLPSIAGQYGGQTEYCKAIVSMEIIECVLGFVLALVADVAAEAITGGTSTPVIVAIAIVEFIMFALGIAISVLSYKDCIA